MHRKTTSAILALGGAVTVVIGSFLPWVSLRQPWVFSGIELPASVYFGRPFISDPPWLSPNPSPFASAGALLIVMAIIGTIGARRWPMIALGIAVLVISAPVLVLMTIDREPEYSVPQAVGSGLGVVLLGGIAYLVGGVLAWADSRRESARTSSRPFQVHP